MFHSDCVYIQVPLNYDNQSKREGKKLSTYHIRRKQVTKLSLKKKNQCCGQWCVKLERVDVNKQWSSL